MSKILEKHTSRSLKLIALFMVILTATVAFQFTTLVSAQSQNSNSPISNDIASRISLTQGSVTWYAEDTTTHGNWVGTYGSYAHMLPCPPVNLLEIPIGSMFKLVCGVTPTIDTFNWTDNQISGLPYNKSSPPYWDEYASKYPYVTYKMDGTYIIFADHTPVKEPVFEWAWDSPHATQTDLREVYYSGSYKCATPIGDCTDTGTCCGKGWRLACWDDGGERCQPVNGYFNVTMYFPQGTYLLSLYAYDYEHWPRDSQEYRIYSANGQTLLASHQISGQAFDDGVYATFKVVAPYRGLTIIVQVYNDAGHVSYQWPYPQDRTYNVLLSGIFVDKI